MNNHIRVSLGLPEHMERFWDCMGSITFYDVPAGFYKLARIDLTRRVGYQVGLIAPPLPDAQKIAH